MRADSLSNILLGEKIPLDVVNAEMGVIIIPANSKITKILLRKVAMVRDYIQIDPSPICDKGLHPYEPKIAVLDFQRERTMEETWTKCFEPVHAFNH